MTAVRAWPLQSDRWWAKPFQIHGVGLPPNVVLMAKLVVLAFLLQRQLPLSDHFLPFIPLFDRLGSPGLFHATLLLLFIAGSTALFLNWQVRNACILLGSTILISILASRPTYSNNLAYCGALLFMIGLQEPGRQPYLLRLQIVMLYLGAGLNKLLDPDWRSGQFFEYWFGHVHSNGWYLWISGHLPPLLLSMLISWASFVTELALAATLLIRRLGPLPIWIGLAFHTGMLVLTGLTFHMFYFAATASYLAFITWPQERMTLTYDEECGLSRKLHKLFSAVDLEKRVNWVAFQHSDRDQWNMSVNPLRECLCLQAGNKQYSGFAALQMLMLFNPLTYFALVILLRIPDVLDQRRWIALAALLFFSPVMRPVGELAYRLMSRKSRGTLQARAVQL
jgi:hypothetical protein